MDPITPNLLHLTNVGIYISAGSHFVVMMQCDITGGGPSRAVLIKVGGTNKMRRVKRPGEAALK